MRNGLRRTITAGVLVSVCAAAAAAGAASQIRSDLTLFGIGYVVKQFGPQINSAINTLMLDNKVANQEATKVVPILSVGGGDAGGGEAYVGAAQVQGPKAAVNQVQAVAQIEGSFGGDVPLRGLVPVNSLNPSPGNLHRVYGVGVGALVDFRP